MTSTAARTSLIDVVLYFAAGLFAIGYGGGVLGDGSSRSLVHVITLVALVVAGSSALVACALGARALAAARRSSS